MEALAQVADDLYGLPREEFIRGRDERAAQERRDGRTELADDIRTLRKPSAAAWIINMLVRDNVEVLQDLVAVGKQMRERPDGVDFRSLERQRKELLRAAVDAARTTAAEHEVKVGPAAVSSLEETMHAGFADPDGARAVLSGRLVREISAVGFEPVDLADAVAVADDLPELPDHEPRQPRAETSSDDKGTSTAVTAARAAVKAARQAAKSAQKEAETARRRRDELQNRRDVLNDELHELGRQAKELEGRIADLDTGLRRRERDVEDTEEARVSADQDLDRAKAALEED